MIVISAGMQKSGSGYIYNIINDLLFRSGHADARQVKGKYHLEKMMNWHNNNIGNPTLTKLFRLLLISFMAKTFCVKTHEGPSRWMKRLIKVGFVKVIYSFRDPRDVYLSALDHGKKIIEKGENHTFAGMLDLEAALGQLDSWIRKWRAYRNMQGILMIRYEDLLEDPHEKVRAISNYLKIRIREEDIDVILKKYDPNNPRADMTGLHFNKARTERYKSELSTDIRTLIESNFQKDMEIMGYEI